MKLLKLFTAFALIFVFSTAAVAQRKNSGVYLFAVSSSLTDSVVSVSSIQHLDTVSLTKDKILPYTPNYSMQFRNYLEVVNDRVDQIVAVFYSKTEKKVKKDRVKIIKRYQKKMKAKVEDIPSTDFVFSPVIPE